MNTTPSTATREELLRICDDALSDAVRPREYPSWWLKTAQFLATELKRLLSQEPKTSEGELLPCPFCGSSRIVEASHGGTHSTVGCIDCDAGITSHNAVKDWNTRIEQQPAQGVPEDDNDFVKAICTGGRGEWHKSEVAAVLPDGSKVTNVYDAFDRGVEYGKATSARWLDISSAPKDGTRIILYWGNKSRVGYYLDNTKTSHPWEGWKVPSMEEWPHNSKPTHWMPLPAAPSPQTEQRSESGVGEEQSPLDDKSPYWLLYALAEYVDGDECQVSEDGCAYSGNCITEYCAPCAAKAWMKSQGGE